jgi:sulfate adenylyltransferase
MISMERGHFYLGGKLTGISFPTRIYPCETPEQLRKTLPHDKVKDEDEYKIRVDLLFFLTCDAFFAQDVVAFQCRNPIHRAHYELFIRSLQAPNVGSGAVVLVHPTCGPTQEDDIDGITRYEMNAHLP